MSAPVRRASAWLAGAWAGLIAAIGFVAAPLLFATLPREAAGRVATRLVAVDALIGVVAGALLLVLAQHEARRRADAGGSRFSAEMVLALAALFCIVAGHYAIEPMLAAARGDGTRMFAVLHGVASVFFVVKFALVAALAWRLTRSRATDSVATPPAASSSAATSS